jgi:hypothetical protein
MPDLPPELSGLVESQGRSARFEDIGDLPRVDERVASLASVFANIIGVNEGYISWLPNHDPPALDERLAWLWIVRPDLGPAVARYCSSEGLKVAIERYEREGTRLKLS